MTDLSWVETKRLVFKRANGCCEYCQTCEHNIGQPMHTEHIIPNKDNSLDNLCLACASCNLSKGTATEGIDPKTSEIQQLFNPRSQIWEDHFLWSEDGTHVVGKTGTGRATVSRLKMNQKRLVRARKNWVLTGN
ncbi:MAG: HNH endonuclease signature motif containing protein, partial [Chloroflexota bacterium]